ncbi:hypothetical protein OSTOST_06204 [Ostertagia ostertagi]
MLYTEWNETLYELAKQDLTQPLPSAMLQGYEGANLWNYFEKSNSQTMKKKVKSTMQKKKNRQYLTRAINGLEGESAKFGCYCDYGNGTGRDDMQIQCYFK